MHSIWAWILELFGRAKRPSGALPAIGEAEAREASSMIAAGMGVGALAAVEIAVGSLCPICVVAAPALITVGLYKRWRAHVTAARVRDLS